MSRPPQKDINVVVKTLLSVKERKALAKFKALDAPYASKKEAVEILKEFIDSKMAFVMKEFGPEE